MTVNDDDPKINPDFRASSWEIPLPFESSPTPAPWKPAVLSQVADFLISECIFCCRSLSPSHTICHFASLQMDPFQDITGFEYAQRCSTARRTVLSPTLTRASKDLLTLLHFSEV